MIFTAVFEYCYPIMVLCPFVCPFQKPLHYMGVSVHFTITTRIASCSQTILSDVIYPCIMLGVPFSTEEILADSNYRLYVTLG